MAVWPASLPKPRVEGYVETPADYRLVSEMQTGPVKMRSRAVPIPGKVQGNLYLSEALLTVFKTFWATDTANGILSFTYTLPRSGVEVTARFNPNSPPPQESPGNKAGTSWVVPLDLEVLS
jgi:hypothetical protein